MLQRKRRTMKEESSRDKERGYKWKRSVRGTRIMGSTDLLEDNKSHKIKKKKKFNGIK